MQGAPKRRVFILGAFVAPLYVGTALAQTTPSLAQHPASTAHATAHSATTKAQNAASIECSKQADAKNLHGKARKQFRSSCKKQMTKKS